MIAPPRRRKITSRVSRLRLLPKATGRSTVTFWTKVSMKPTSKVRDISHCRNAWAGRIALGLWISVASIGAATGQSNDILDLSPEELKNVQVYTASMYVQKSREAPSAVTVITADNSRFLKETWPAVSETLSLCVRARKESGSGPVPEKTMAELLQLVERADLSYALSEIPHAIDGTLEGVARVSKIVRAMKEFSHPGAEGKFAVNLNHAIETTVAVARNEWKYVADVQTCFDESLPPVPCLAGEFNQVILNLLINAAHSVGDAVGRDSGSKGTITVTTRCVGDWAEVQIRDTGTGIPENIRARIFEPFFTTKEVGKGTGQGLALAHAFIVKKHNGQIWFESEVGKGATFFLRLPLGTCETVARPATANS